MCGGNNNSLGGVHFLLFVLGGGICGGEGIAHHFVLVLLLLLLGTKLLCFSYMIQLLASFFPPLCPSVSVLLHGRDWGCERGSGWVDGLCGWGWVISWLGGWLGGWLSM